MFNRLFVWIINKIPHKRRKALLKKISFIPAAKRKYQEMETTDNFKPSDGYFNVAIAMKENIYPRIFEVMDRHGMDYIILSTKGIKDFKIDIDGLVSMKATDGTGWEELGNSINDEWDPLFRVCNSKKNIMTYSKIAESLMNKLDELIGNDVKNRDLCERAQRFGTVYERNVIIEKIEQD